MRADHGVRSGGGGRSLAAAALTVLPLVVVVWTARAWRDRLPDPLPTHWSALSGPDGFSSYDGTWRTLAAVAIAGAVLGVVGAVLSWVSPLSERATTGLGAAGAFGALGVWLAIAHAAWGRADAHGSSLGWGVLLPIVAGILGAIAVFGAIGPRPHTIHRARRTDGPSSGLVVGPGEHPVWTHRIFVVWPLAIAGAMGVLAVGVALAARPAAAVVLVIAGLVVAAFAWVRVTVDERGLRLGLGPWGSTVKVVRLDAIVDVAAESISALDWGGWGYRVRPGRSALVLSSGPAIVVDLDDGRRFAVTVDDPQPAVDLLQALRVRAAHGSTGRTDGR